MPFRVEDRVDSPVSLYAATKKSGELISETYAHLYRIPLTGLRFFTVYGAWGRPDMAPILFARAMLAGQSIDVFNDGDMLRDFTYIDDLIEGILRLTDVLPVTRAGDFDSLSPVAPWRVVNIGNRAPIRLMAFVEAIEAATGRNAVRNYLPMQPGDVPATWADATLLEALIGPLPQTDIRDGVARFVDWYRDYHRS